MKLHATVWLAPLALLLPLLWLNLLALFGHSDALFYTTLMQLSGQQFVDGDFWPRWLMNADAGLGAPLMYFYPPLPYLLTALPTWFMPDAGMRMLAGMWLAAVASGYASYFWLRRHFAARAALVGAALYILLPYRLEYMYLHFNLAQLWALAWLPLWMLSCDSLLKRKWRGVAGFALCAAAVGYTHPLTLLAFGIIPVAYVIWAGGRKALLPLLAACVLSAALLASYVTSFVFARGWLTGEFTAGKYNVFANLSHVDSALLAGYLAVAVVAYLRARRGAKLPEAYAFWAVVLAALWAMTLAVSSPLWHALPPLQLLQFPAARLHAGMLVAVAWLAAALVARPLKQAPLYLRLPVLAALLGIMLAATLAHMEDVYRQTLSLTPQYLQAMRGNAIVTVPFHLRWSDMDDVDIYHERLRIKALPEVAGPGVAVRRWKPGNIALAATIKDRQDVVLVRQRFTPAWSAFDRTAGVPVTVEPWGEEGIMALTLPRGTHEVRLRLLRNDWQRGADALSLFALALGTLLLVRRRHG